MKRTDFFSIASKATAQGLHCWQLVLHKDCDIYRGHFPQQAIAPGVCSIEMIKACAEDLLGTPLRINHIAQCRFTELITPDTHSQLCLQMQVDAQPEGWQIVASLHHQDKVCLELKASLQNA